MDEPFGAVDPPTRERLQDEFLRLQSNLKKTVLFVTHDLEEAVKIADRICLMSLGQVEQYDPPETLLRLPSSAFVREFLGPSRTLLRLSRIPITDLIRPLEGQVPTVWIKQAATAREAFAVLLSSGHRMVGVQEADQTVGQVTLETLLASVVEEG